MKEYKGMIPDTFFETSANSELEARKNIILGLKKKFEAMEVDELIEEFSLIVWEDDEEYDLIVK